MHEWFKYIYIYNILLNKCCHPFYMNFIDIMLVWALRELSWTKKSRKVIVNWKSLAESGTKPNSIHCLKCAHAIENVWGGGEKLKKGKIKNLPSNVLHNFITAFTVEILVIWWVEYMSPTYMSIEIVVR